MQSRYKWVSKVGLLKEDNLGKMYYVDTDGG